MRALRQPSYQLSADVMLDGMEIQRPAHDPQLLTKRNDNKDKQKGKGNDCRLCSEADLGADGLSPGDLEIADNESAER